MLNHREKKSYSKIKQHTMKKRIKIVGIVFVMAVLVWAMPESLAQVSVVNGSNQIRINYKMPRYTLAESEVNEVIGGNGFQFVSIQVSDEEYGVVADEGRPQLPQRTLFLAVPSNAVDFQVRMTGAVQGTRSLPAGTYVEPYMDTDPENPVWEFDKAYYITSDTSYLEQFYEVEECFTMMGERILPVTLLPFRYVPKKGVVEELRSASFIVTWNLQGPAGAKQARSRLKESYVSTMVDNYDASKGGPVLDRVRYLIITASEFADEMAFFKEYKENLGYEVAMATTDQTGSSPASISAYIRNADPDFVLLVGDIGVIPHAGGNPASDKDDPMTDQGYRRFNDNKWSYGDVFLGRWPVVDETHIFNLIQKTIYMETHLAEMTKEAFCLVGEDDVFFLNWARNDAMDYVVKNGFNNHGFVARKYYQASESTIELAMKACPAWFAYLGHGNKNQLAYFENNSDLIQPSDFEFTTAMYPMVWGFTCLAGNYNTESKIFPLEMLNVSKRAVSLFASSVKVYNNPDCAIAKKILGDNLGQQNLGAMATKGMSDYANRFWSLLAEKRTKRYLKSFNLFGDPSLLVAGLKGGMNQYVFNEKISYGGVKLALEAQNSIEVLKGLSLLKNGVLLFESGGDAVLKGECTIRGDMAVQAGGNVALDDDFEVYGMLTVEAGGNVVLGSDTRIRYGSNIHIKAGGEIVLQVGCQIEDGVIAVFETID